MYRRFALEGEVHTNLDCVPLAVRRKLDLAALKISLSGWQTLTRAERLALCHLPVDTDEDVSVYVEVLRGFASRSGVGLGPLPDAPIDRSAWSAAGVCARIRARVGPEGTPTEEAIAHLSEEERFALFKLADPKRESTKLLSLMRELGLTAPASVETAG